MITGRRALLQARARERGYTWEEIQPCIISVVGDQVTVDESHPAYPRVPRPASGPGVWLKWLLKTVGHIPSNCACNKHAAQMNAWGPWRCLWNYRVILGWLKDESHKRKLKWRPVPAGVAVVLAILLSAISSIGRKLWQTR